VSGSSDGRAAPPPENLQSPKEPLSSSSFIGTLKLIIPVAGVRSEQLQDTYTDARSEGRAHDAIDIMAPAGTPVMAASDGEIVRLFQSDRGGTTIYQLNPDKKLVFYYAHLQRYADGLVVGKFARQGEVIGYVGDTGNAGAGNYHLHFSIAVLADPKRYWAGTNINPYPLLRR
jgi:murein DD-endopeptidase MepM/ murein hydrolase activator NlpD